MPSQPQDSAAVYDAYLSTCLDGTAEDPDVFLAGHPDTDAETCELVRALHREYVEAPALTADTGLPDALPFERLGGYRLLRRLGEGGMGTVYLAEQETLGRKVAVKVLRPELAGSKTMLRRFAREAHAIARLRHPGIVSVHEFGEDQGVQFIAMEHVDGRPLDAILREDGPVPAPQLFRWAAQVGSALAYAHDKGVVHRDVKPGNILITAEGHAVLLDFGIAYLTGLEASRLTQSFAGSPLYAAPEQIASGEVGPQTDVYLLGVTTYEALTGELPFRGKTLEKVFRRVLLEDATPPSRLHPAAPRAADVVLLKAMEKRPAARYSDMVSFVADLEALAGAKPVVARAPGPWTRVRKWGRRSPVRATIVGALFLAVLGVAAVLVHSAMRRAAARREEALGRVERARELLADYREARLGNEENEDDLRWMRMEIDSKFLTEEQDRRHEELLDQLEKVGVERDLMFSRVLELLQQARELYREVPGVDEVTALLWLERVEEARTRRDQTTAARFRAKIAEYDPDGRFTGPLLKSGSVIVVTEPPGFEVYAFRHELQRDVVPDGDRRLVPVPMQGAPTPVPPGTWTLRVVKGAGDIRPGDQVLEILGHAVQGTVLAAASHETVQRGDRLVRIDDRPILLPLDAARPVGDGPHRYRFDRRGEEIEVEWSTPPIPLLSAAALAERGGARARVYQDGTVRELDLPRGLVVRTTAIPLFASSGCRVGVTPTGRIPFEPGRYAFLVRKEGYEAQILQLRIQGGWTVEPQLAPHPIGTTPPGFVYVAEAGVDGTPFWIQEHEVTNGEYLEFLNDPTVLARVDAALAEDRFILYPRSVRQNGSVGGFWPRADDGRFVLPPDWGPDRPVMTMTLKDVRDYARWRSERDGRTYALPTRSEFQAAAYGSSQFAYPFGDSFRPKWVSSRTARETYRGFDPVMSFPVDESAAGVYDLSGSVTEMIEWDGSRGTRGMSVGGSALRGVVWEFAMTSLHPRNPDYAGGDCGFRLIFRRDER